MSGTTEAFARVKIDALLKDSGWNLTDGSSVLFEHAFPDGTQAGYVGEYQNPWGQSSRHRRSNVQAPTPNACSAFRRRTVSPFDPTDFDASH